MSNNKTEIRVKGKGTFVPSAQIEGRTVISSHKWLRIATVHDEELVEGEAVADPESFVAQLKQTRLNADIFTFAQRLCERTPRHAYHQEWDNLAVIPITTYSDWFKNRTESSAQRAVRKAAKSGVEVRLAQLDDEYVNGMVQINNETPVRQGRRFWHYQKSFEAVKREALTYSDRNTFLGAYLNGELIGFLRMTRADKVSHIIQVLTMMKHFDKRPANALIAKAVEICERDGMSCLTYCNYLYKDPKSSLTEFKKRCGFEKVLVPRYYIPLTFKGKIALRLGLHHGLTGAIPQPLIRQLLKIRSFCHGYLFKPVKETV